MKCPNCKNEIRAVGIGICPMCGYVFKPARHFSSTEQNDTNVVTEELIDSVWPEWKMEKKPIGQGSYGVVYRAVKIEPGNKSYSAIKVISIPASEAEWNSVRSEGVGEKEARAYYFDIVQEYKNEIRILQTLKDSAGIVEIEEYKIVERTDRVGWDIYIRMELLTPLNSYVGKRNLSEHEIIKLGCDICEALDACTKRNIIHRDIKPENIFVTQYGNFKLGDFGVARRSEHTMAASYKGSPSYMAPEVIVGEEYDARVDIYSLGIMLYRFLNNKRLPFMDVNKSTVSPIDHENAWKRRMSGETLPRPCDASEGIADVVIKACSFQKENRFSSASEMRQALLNCRNADSEPFAQNPKAGKRTDKLVGITAAVVIGLALVIIFGVALSKRNANNGDDSQKTVTPGSNAANPAAGQQVSSTPAQAQNSQPTGEVTIAAKAAFAEYFHYDSSTDFFDMDTGLLGKTYDELRDLFGSGVIGELEAWPSEGDGIYGIEVACDGVVVSLAFGKQILCKASVVKYSMNGIPESTLKLAEARYGESYGFFMSPDLSMHGNEWAFNDGSFYTETWDSTSRVFTQYYSIKI